MNSPAPMTPTFPSCGVKELDQLRSSVVRTPTHRISKNVKEDSAHVHRPIVTVTSVNWLLVVRVSLRSMIVPRVRTVVVSGMRPAGVLAVSKLHSRNTESAVARVSRTLRAVPSVVRRLDNVLPKLSWVHKQLLLGELLRILFAGGGRAGAGHGDGRGGGDDGGSLRRGRLGEEGSAVGSVVVVMGVDVLGSRLGRFLVAVRVAVPVRVPAVRVPVV